MPNDCVPSTTVTDPGGCIVEQTTPPAGVGELCDTHLGCAQGQACLDADIVGPGCDGCRCCTEFCTVGEPDTCSGLGQTCRPAHNPDYPNLGYCGAA